MRLGINSPVAYDLYMIHEDKQMTLNEKITVLSKKYTLFNSDSIWETVELFFENPIYTRTAYYCETYANTGRGAFANKYVKSNISYEDAVKSNVYFYILLTVIGGKNEYKAHTKDSIEDSLNTDRYLNEYARQHGIQYEENNGRYYGRYFICLLCECVDDSCNGHSIYKSIEIPI